jgi:hypothetical protein
MKFNYRAKKWRRLSREMQMRAGWECEIAGCGRTKLELQAIGQHLVTHHRVDANRFPERAFDPMLLLVCCEECHERIHGRIFHARKPAMTQQLDFWPATLQLDSDMQLFEARDLRRQRANYLAETQLLADAYRRSCTYDRIRVIREANELAEQQRQKWREVGLLEDGYSESGVIATGEESDGTTTTETANPHGRRSS